MDADRVLVGINAGDRITQGQFFRLTFAPARHLMVHVSVFSFSYDMEQLYAELDSADGWLMPASDLNLPPGAEAIVFDALIRPFAVGVTAADLANYLDSRRMGVSLTSLTPIDVASVQNGSTDRDTLQNQLDAAERSKDPLQVFGSYARVLEIALVVLLVVAAVYYGEKALKVVKVAL